MINGKRINLRLVGTIEECQAFIEAYNDLSERAASDHTEIKSVTTLQTQFSQDGLWSDQAGTLLITNKDDVIIGSIGFTSLSPFELEIGYRLFKQADHGKGYVSEALSLFSAYLFTTKPIHRLRIQTANSNIGSQKVAEKCGFQREGILRQAYFYRGEMHDTIIYGLLRDECESLTFML